jgi:protein-disulfide isomerase-like protein with CxxC motif
MRLSKQTTVVILAGAVGLASIAYAIGSAGGGGSAVAESGSAQRSSDQSGPPGGFRDGGPFGEGALDDLADALGTDTEKLQDALRDFHEQNHSDRREEFAAALAKALGKSTEDVQAAFEKLMGTHEARFAERLADELGIDAGKVEQALGELRDERPGEPGGFAAALAEKLGVDADKVEQALHAIRPRDFDRGDRHGPPRLGQLAQALGVTQAELRKAFEELRASADSSFDDKRADLVAFLAKRFGVSEDKVEEALPEFPGPGPGWHGRGGPGGPGPGGPGPGGPGGPGEGFGPGPPPGIPG